MAHKADHSEFALGRIFRCLRGTLYSFERRESKNPLTFQDLLLRVMAFHKGDIQTKSALRNKQPKQARLCNGPASFFIFLIPSSVSTHSWSFHKEPVGQ